MYRNFIGVGLVAVLLLVGFIFLLTQGPSAPDKDNNASQNGVSASPTEAIVRPSDEDAELAGFGFIQDFIASSDPEAQKRAYNALSKDAQEGMSQESLKLDLLDFVGVQDVPDQGASVEDLQIENYNATLIVGLNYSSGRVLRAVVMGVENGVWKVDTIKPLDEYPPSE